MSDVEVDSFEGEGKPFDPDKSSKPLDAPVNVAVELGLETSQADDENPDKDDLPDEEGAELPEKSKVTLENYAAKLQEESESLYESMSYRAKTEDGYLDKLISSSDSLEKKMAAKILSRNSEHFGAKTIDDYKLKLETDKEETPEGKELAKIKHKQAQQDERQNQLEWEAWKKDNAVKGEAEKVADEIHEKYPDLDRGLLMDAVKSRIGGKKPSQKEAGSTAIGGEGVPQEESLDTSSPMAKTLLRKVDLKETKKFAKKYMT